MRPVLLLAAVGCFALCPPSAVAQPTAPSAVAEPLAATPISPETEPVLESAPLASPGGWGTFIVTPEYVLWWIREAQVPALLTTSSTASQGRLGAPDTRVLYGDDRLETRHGDRFNGGRLTLEWQNADSTFGVEARGFVLERDSTHFLATSNGSELLAMPFTNALNGQPGRLIIAGFDPQRGLLSGGFVGYSRIEWFGEEVNAVLPLMSAGGWRIDLLGGARFLQMRDRFDDTATSSTVTGVPVLYGVVDNIRVGNAFYGGQVGVRGEVQFGRFFVQLRGTIALGDDDERVRTFGGSLVQTSASRITAPVGLYIQPSNSGEWMRDHFDGTGEAAFNVGYRLTSWARIFAGYTFLYWADPLRASEQINTVVNPVQARVPNPAQPVIPFKGDALWAQGVNAGLEFQW